MTYTPAMTFNVYDAKPNKNRPVYRMILHSAQDNYTAASSPITAKAVRLGRGNVDIYISNSDAAKVRASSPDFRKTCRVIVVSR